MEPGAIICFILMVIGLFALLLSIMGGNNCSNLTKSVILFFISLFAIGGLRFASQYGNINIVHILAVFLLLCILQLHKDFSSHRVSNYSVYFLVICAIVAVMFASSADNFITLYLAFETISFVGYILVSLLANKDFSSEGSVKYFVVGGISSAVMLFGVSFIYGVSGSVLFSQIPVGLENKMLLVGFVLFLIGILFKLTSFPLHFWAPDVYSIANLPAVSVIAVLPKVAALLAFANFLPFVDVKIFPVITFCAFASIVIGSFGAIFQNNIQKILSYSGIANMGYIFSMFASDAFNLAVLLEFIVIYSISALFVVMVLSSISKNFNYDGTVAGIKGLSRTNPFLAGIFVLSLLNLAGIPPLAGFFAKYIVIYQFILAGNWFMPFVIVLSSAVTLFYYLKIVKNIYFDEPSKELEIYKNISISLWFKIYVAIIAVLVLSYSYIGNNFQYKKYIGNYIIAKLKV